ncbi:MAG: DUF4405 domain-containing protein [Thermosipho sp. (in: Bacteria)]|nr:DUF4405 domain-containing protein [Thermosipho sp. (in: thermotogales)]
MRGLIKSKAVISVVLIIVFLIVLISGIGLDIAPSGRIARDTSWEFLGFDRDSLKTIHVWSGYIMAGLIVVHFLILNLKMFICELGVLFKSKNKLYVKR